VKRRPAPLLYAVENQGRTHYFPDLERAVAYLASFGEPEFLYLSVNLAKIGRL
jgi:hypothetical protein